MLEDRDYMRQPVRHRAVSTTLVLTIIFVVVFALQCINDVYLQLPVENWLALTREGLKHGWLWQLLTFQFLHLNLVHIFCNLIVFWWVGRFVENVMGTKKFLIAFFGCGAVGGILQGVLMLLFPSHFGAFTVGASAGVSGLLAIFALLERDAEIRLYWVLPIRAIALLWLLAGVSLFFTLVPTPRELGIAYAAHLGGILAGIAWVKLGWHRDYMPLPWEGWFERIKHWKSSQNRQRKRELVITRAGKNSIWRSATGKSDDDASTDDFLKNEVDPILEKISAHGIQSLTAREREILEKARAKMTGH
jgi:membrane associated rhomboid family serine protease